VKDFNMSERHADELAHLLGHRKAIMNLIPMNPFPGSRWQRPDTDDVERFKELLVKRKLRVMVRGTKGDDILAACGQLKVESSSRRKHV
jgi:23S rRNA (adenine2503-C2)-methyltransferase